MDTTLPTRLTPKLLWSLPFLATFLPIVLLTVYASRLATDSVEQLVETENVSATKNLSQLMSREFTQGIHLIQAMASVPGTVKAVDERDVFTLNTRLKAIAVSYPTIERAYVTNAQGAMWSAHPQLAAALRDHSQSEWFQGIQSENKTYVSGLHPRDDQFIFSIATPMRGSGSQLAGFLVFEYTAKQFIEWLQSIQISRSGYVYILDHHGSVVAHPRIPVTAHNKQYASLTAVKQAQAGTVHTSLYIDPIEKREMIATFLPVAVGGNQWLIVAQQPADLAFAEVNRVKINIGLMGLALSVLTLGMIIALARMSAKNLRLNRELGEKNQALEDFSSIVSHQLKAPITAMRWTIESMLDGDYGAITDKIRDVLGDLYKVNKGNYQLIMDLLNISRLDRGVVVMDTKALSFKDIADRVLRDYAPAAEKAGLYLKTEGDDSITVKADLEKAAESITNSISNAIKHTKEGGITLKFSKRDGMGVIEVIDTGEGMPPEILEHLFSRDGIRKSNTSAESSSGLGLYIAKKFMQMQGGDVVASSVEGQGSTFTYTLPLAT